MLDSKICFQKDTGDTQRLLQGFDPFIMLLQYFGVIEKVFNVCNITVDKRVFILRPSEKRGIICEMNVNIGSNSRSSPRPLRFFFCRDYLWQKLSTVEYRIKIMEGLNAGKHLLRKFAKQRHEAGVPYPNLRITERFVHIRILRHTLYIPDMVVSKLPSFFIEPCILGTFF